VAAANGPYFSSMPGAASETISLAISNYDKEDWSRKRNYAKLIEENKYDSDGSKNTVSVTESIARIENEEFEKKVVEALRQKEKAKMILSATNQVLNSISSRSVT